MNETLTHLSKVLPELVILAAVSGFFGWFLHRPSAKPAAKSSPVSDRSQQDRAKNLEAALEKSKAAHKSLKAELEKFQSTSVSQAAHENATAELEAARKMLDTETKRIATLEADLKKSQDSVRNLNARANEADKVQKDRSFAVENELSKAREQLALLQNRPDDGAELHAEIERLRESVAVSTRFAGEMRKREAAAVEALEKSEARLADQNNPSRPTTVSKKIGPVGDSGRIAAAKAEVIRLVALNKQIAAAAPAQEIMASVDDSASNEEVPASDQDVPDTDEELPVLKKNPANEELFVLD